ncbi:hypothetical protein QBC41DRAFT_358211 [Cercophora samala]|uniref:Uncharacterized protein n=1 Tax=Cercophora samala TaxID=330535 RepID=A0AA39Z8R5_9PEZI|nr:hypothetical protein QBC41DRAFT_358211 [Cercophora samala]
MSVRPYTFVSTTQQVEVGLLSNGSRRMTAQHGNCGSAGINRKFSPSKLARTRRTYSMLLLSSVNGYIPRPAVSHCVPSTGSHRYFALTTPTPLLTSSPPDEKRHGQVVGARKPMRERQKVRLQPSSLLHHGCLLWWYIDSPASQHARLLKCQREARQRKRFAN